MDCPNCNNEMKDKSYSYYSIGAWDCDYPDAHHEEYYCKGCKIRYKNGDWKIPKDLEATDKQSSTVNIICKNLQMTHKVTTKKDAWLFINKYLSKSMSTARNRSQLDEDINYIYSDDMFY